MTPYAALLFTPPPHKLSLSSDAISRRRPPLILPGILPSSPIGRCPTLPLHHRPLLPFAAIALVDTPHSPPTSHCLRHRMGRIIQEVALHFMMGVGVWERRLTFTLLPGMKIGVVVLGIRRMVSGTYCIGGGGGGGGRRRGGSGGGNDNGGSH